METSTGADHSPVHAYDLVRRDLAGVLRASRTRAAAELDPRRVRPAHHDRITAETGVTPAINQIELHPCRRAGLRREHAELGK